MLLTIPIKDHVSFRPTMYILYIANCSSYNISNISFAYDSRDYQVRISTPIEVQIGCTQKQVRILTSKYSQTALSWNLKIHVAWPTWKDNGQHTGSRRFLYHIQVFIKLWARSTSELKKQHTLFGYQVCLLNYIAMDSREFTDTLGR